VRGVFALLLCLAACQASDLTSTLPPPQISSPEVHGAIVSLDAANSGAMDIVVAGDSLSTPVALSDAPIWEFRVPPNTAVWWSDRGIASVTDLAVGRVVWVQFGSPTTFESYPPQQLAGIIVLERR
jgi:hypothetical protein